MTIPPLGPRAFAQAAGATTTPPEAPTLEVEPDWIMVGGVSLPRRAG